MLLFAEPLDSPVARPSLDSPRTCVYTASAAHPASSRVPQCWGPSGGWQRHGLLHGPPLQGGPPAPQKPQAAGGRAGVLGPRGPCPGRRSPRPARSGGRLSPARPCLSLPPLLLSAPARPPPGPWGRTGTDAPGPPRLPSPGTRTAGQPGSGGLKFKSGLHVAISPPREAGERSGKERLEDHSLHLGDIVTFCPLALPMVSTLSRGSPGGIKAPGSSVRQHSPPRRAESTQGHAPPCREKLPGATSEGPQLPRRHPEILRGAGEPRPQAAPVPWRPGLESVSPRRRPQSRRPPAHGHATVTANAPSRSWGCRVSRGPLSGRSVPVGRSVMRGSGQSPPLSHQQRPAERDPGVPAMAVRPGPLQAGGPASCPHLRDAHASPTLFLWTSLSSWPPWGPLKQNLCGVVGRPCVSRGYNPEGRWGRGDETRTPRQRTGPTPVTLWPSSAGQGPQSRHAPTSPHFPAAALVRPGFRVLALVRGPGRRSPAGSWDWVRKQSAGRPPRPGGL